MNKINVLEIKDISVEGIVKLLQNTLFIISDFAYDNKTYKDTIEKFYDFIKQGFEFKELRTCPVYFKFRDSDGETIYTLQLRHFLTNLMFWEPIIKLKKYDLLDESYIVDCSKISSQLIKSYIDNKIILPFCKTVKNRKLNMIISDMIYNLSRISTDFNMILGLSINIETFIDLSNRNKRFDEIIHTKLDENLQPTENEEILNNLMREQIDILMNDSEDNLLKPILKSGSGIKHKQLSEFSINGGFKPDLDGNTIPIPINSNFVVGGLSNITNYYIDSLGGRKSVIMNKTVMGRSGHFSRTCMLLTSGLRLREDEKSCNTLNPILYKIKSKEHLKRLIGRYYRLPHKRNYTVLRGVETELIGQEILVKSPITCASKKGICKECYGEDLYYINRNISIGAYAGIRITNPISQRVLSAKHILTTVSEKIEFDGEFDQFFVISANEIILNTSNEDIDLNDYSLLIIHKNIMSINQYDESDYNDYVTIFHVKNKKTGEIFEIHEKTFKELFISPEIMEFIRGKQKEIYEIDFAKIDDESKLFVLEIENNELTRPLYNIIKLLNRSDHLGCSTIDDMAQTMLDLLIESKIDSRAVHGEILINPLIRDAEMVLDRPKFQKYLTDKDYQILTVEAALEKHPSVLISFSFQALGRQLTNPLTFRKKSESFIDPFFKENP